MLRTFIILIILFVSISSCEDSKLLIEYKNFTDKWPAKEKAVLDKALFKTRSKPDYLY